MKETQKIIIVILAIFLGYNSSLKAQTPMSLYFLETIPQSIFTNSAHAPRTNVFVGVPIINSVYFKYNSNLAIHTLVQSSKQEAILPLHSAYDFHKLYKGIGDKMSIRNNVELTPVFFGFRMKKSGYLNISISLKMRTNARVAKGFFALVEKGTPHKSNFSFKGTGLDAQIYQEYAVGYSRNISNRLRVGGKLKLLQGLVALKTDIKKADLETSRTEWNIATNGVVYSSGPLNITTTENGKIDKIKLKKEFEKPDIPSILQNNILNFSNNGFALDLGVNYQFNQVFSASASVNDLGFIRWRKNLNSVHFNGKYTFDGLAINNNNIDSLKKATDALMDTIKNQLNYTAGSHAFNTNIGTNINVGGQYHLNHVISFGLLSRSTFYKDYFHQEFNISANFNLYHAFSASVNYNYALSGQNDLGLAFSLRGGILQYYMVLDHIPTTFNKYKVDNKNTILAPYDFRAFSIMFGFNFVFGSGGFKDMPKINTYSEF